MLVVASPLGVLALRCELANPLAHQAPCAAHRLPSPLTPLQVAHPSTKLLWLHAGDDTGARAAELAGTHAKGRRTR